METPRIDPEEQEKPVFASPIPVMLCAQASAIRLIDRSVECGLRVIMPQAKVLLRRRNPRIADDHPPPASPWSKETRRSGFFETKSLSNRRCKENPGLLYSASGWSGFVPTKHKNPCRSRAGGKAQKDLSYRVSPVVFRRAFLCGAASANSKTPQHQN
jgi:hypothetical protein